MYYLNYRFHLAENTKIDDPQLLIEDIKQALYDESTIDFIRTATQLTNFKQSISIL